MSQHSSSRRRRRRRTPGRSGGKTPDINVATFTDALAEAAAPLDEFGPAVAAYVVDTSGHVIDAWALTASHHQLEDVVLLVLAGDPPASGTGVLLLSSNPGDDLEAMQRNPEEHSMRWQSFRRVFAHRGYHLWDWIHAGDDAFRSMRFSEPSGEDWPAPPLVPEPV